MTNIQTERLNLRPFTLEDACDVQKICDSQDIYATTANLPHPYTIECAQGWISCHKANFENNAHYELAITDKSSGKLIGCVGLSNDKKNKNGEIGYWIDKQYWNRGYCTEAVNALIDYAFKKMDYIRVFARHFSINPASGRVMRKAGMSKEGYQKQAINKNGKFLDIELYAIIKDEWSENRDN